MNEEQLSANQKQELVEPVVSIQRNSYKTIATILSVVVLGLSGLLIYLLMNQDVGRKVIEDAPQVTPGMVSPAPRANDIPVNQAENGESLSIVDVDIFSTYDDSRGLRCSGEECLTIIDDLYGDNVYGYAPITGYYRAEMMESYGSEELCHTFVITSMSQKLRNFADYKIANDNGFYFKPTADGKLLAMIDFSQLNEEQINMLNQSSENQPITLGVVFKTVSVGGYPTCTSAFDVIYLKK